MAAWRLALPSFDGCSDSSQLLETSSLKWKGLQTAWLLSFSSSQPAGRRGKGGRTLHSVLEESVFLLASLVLLTSRGCGLACQASGTLRCGDGAGGGGPKLPKGRAGFEGLCTVPLMTHFRPHGSPLVLERDSKAGIPAQLLLPLLSVPCQVTCLLDFCLYLCLDGREVDGLPFKV